MSLRRHLPRIVLAVAAAASIATSSLEWFIDKSVPLNQLALSDRAPATSYAIHATIDTGEDQPKSRGGEVQVAIDLSAQDATSAQTATVEVDLRAVGRDDEADHQVFTVRPGERSSGRLTVLAWPDCVERSCMDDFTLSVRRMPDQGGPTIEISGTVYIDFSAEGASSPPSGAGINLAVMNLGPVP